MPLESSQPDACPYGAEDCPKLKALYSDISALKAEVSDLKRAIYIMCGILLINGGLSVL